MKKKSVIQKLNKDIDYLLELNVKFHENFSYGKSSWSQWADYQEWINFNMLSLRTIKNLSSQSLYRDAFILNRSVFESYFLIKLAMLGVYRCHSYSLKNNKDGFSSIEEVRNELEKILGKSNVISVTQISKNKLEYTYKVKPVENTKKGIPDSYFYFKEFDAGVCYVDDVLFGNKKTKRKETKRRVKKHKEINRRFLNMPGAILKLLSVNKMATKRQEDAIRIHYNFLSQFAHGSVRSYEILKGGQQKAYLNNLSELDCYNYPKELLLLCYVCHLAIYYIELQIEYYSNEEEIKISSLSKVKVSIDEIKQKYDFFWFIYNNPTEYDAFNYKMDKLYSQKKPTLESDSDIKYYKDPLARLEKLHDSYSNDLAGEYRSPIILK